MDTKNWEGEHPELRMNKPISSWVAALCCTLLALLWTSTAWAERRVALVVGNSQYKNTNLALFNPKNDAEDVAASLRSLGFEVILRIDASRRDFDLAMTQFARVAAYSDTALFYYAGHALQHQGQNYLMPTDAELEDEVSLRYEMVSLDDVRAGLERAGGVKIMILDACRNNPLLDRLKRRMTGMTRDVATVRGLARISGAQGEVVAYATAADQVAADGGGRNSPFTAALLKRLAEAGLEIGTMFRRVAADVTEQTKGQQHPELLISLISEYYLNQNDRPVWERIKDTADPAAFRDFVARFPSSPRASDAQYRLQMLEREPAARQSPQRSRDEDQRAKAEAERQKQQLTLVPPGPPPTDKAAPVTQEQACRRDEERLAGLRASQARDEVARFERELGCERLRPQVVRLRESISAEVERGRREGAQQFQAEEPRPTANAGLQKPERDTLVRNAPASMPQEQICKRDEERLTRLRGSPARDEVIRFEQELGCERLRPQLRRLRESISAEGEGGDREAAQRREIEQPRPTADVRQQNPERDASARVVPSSLPQEQICKRDEERLTRLRASAARDEVIRFERELGCERLRPQVVRLRESLGAN
jgi:Caspase domain